jgi:hypothetical protein
MEANKEIAESAQSLYSLKLIVLHDDNKLNKFFSTGIGAVNPARAIRVKKRAKIDLPVSLRASKLTQCLANHWLCDARALGSHLDH